MLDTITIDEVAKRLGISRTSAFEAARRGDIPALRIGNRLLVPLARLERMLAGDDPLPLPDRKSRTS